MLPDLLASCDLLYELRMKTATCWKWEHKVFAAHRLQLVSPSDSLQPPANTCQPVRKYPYFPKDFQGVTGCFRRIFDSDIPVSDT